MGVGEGGGDIQFCRSKILPAFKNRCWIGLSFLLPAGSIFHSIFGKLNLGIDVSMFHNCAIFCKGIQRGFLVARIPASSGSSSSSPLLAASVSSAVQPLTKDGWGQDCKENCNIFIINILLAIYFLVVHHHSVLKYHKFLPKSIIFSSHHVQHWWKPLPTIEGKLIRAKNYV